MSLIQELKRRNVFRVGVLYLVASWLLLQLTDVLSSLLSVPESAGSIVVMLLMQGFIPVLIFAWVYEMTPEGLKREVDVDRSQSLTPDTGKKINTLTTVLPFADLSQNQDQLYFTDICGLRISTASSSTSSPFKTKSPTPLFRH